MCRRRAAAEEEEILPLTLVTGLGRTEPFVQLMLSSVTSMLRFPCSTQTLIFAACRAILSGDRDCYYVGCYHTRTGCFKLENQLAAVAFFFITAGVRWR